LTLFLKRYIPKVERKVGKIKSSWEVKYMRAQVIYLCPICGHGGTENGQCPECQIPLAEFGEEDQGNFRAFPQVRNAISRQVEDQWYA
jgi:hypothetical protein